MMEARGEVHGTAEAFHLGWHSVGLDGSVPKLAGAVIAPAAHGRVVEESARVPRAERKLDDGSELSAGAARGWRTARASITSAAYARARCGSRVEREPEIGARSAGNHRRARQRDDCSGRDFRQ
jgi:hypothetical protein